jgi:hypothetical protein
MKLEKLNKFSLSQNQIGQVLGGLKKCATVCEEVTQNPETKKCDTYVATSDDSGTIIASKTVAGC